MKHASVHHKSLPTSSFTRHRPVAGPNGLAIAPRTYGIDFVDHQPSTPGEMAVQRRAHEESHVHEGRFGPIQDRQSVIINHGDVIQANGNTKVVAGTEVTFTPGYAQWDQDGDSWHINWRLGEADVYHVTKESEKKIHYFFTIEAGDVSDATAPKSMKGRKGTSKKFSALPRSVQDFITANVSDLMTL
jgi:hypothetical protein